MSGSPWFEDLNVGDEFNNVPEVTITEGHMAAHQMAFGDRLALPLSWPLSKKVTKSPTPLVNSCLVANIAIGLSTIPSQRVLGNLFYRGVAFRLPVFLGDTLKTKTSVVALRQNRIKPGRAASGMAALYIEVSNQEGQSVLNFYRCPMLPCRDSEADTGKNDDFDLISAPLDFDKLKALVPPWNFKEFSPKQVHLDEGQRIVIEARDTVTSAPEIVRLTLNLAMTHLDSKKGGYSERLVYGGHTISLAAAQVSRALPGLITIICWFHCEHLAPVFEGDILRSEVLVNQREDYDEFSILDLTVEVFAESEVSVKEGQKETKVLDWRFGVISKG